MAGKVNCADGLRYEKSWLLARASIPKKTQESDKIICYFAAQKMSDDLHPISILDTQLFKE